MLKPSDTWYASLDSAQGFLLLFGQAKDKVNCHLYLDIDEQ